MAAPIDIIGQKFARLLVISEAKSTPPPKPRRRFVVRCDCGTEKSVDGDALRRGAIRSCGCLKRESGGQFRHGDARKGAQAPEWKTWVGMLGRCHNPNHPAFRYYGGRGIHVAPEWREDYEAFLSHVGRKPTPRHSIDRIDNDGSYEPGNVRWATHSEQMKNRRPRSSW